MKDCHHYFQLLDEARSLLSDWTPDTVSMATRKDYRRIRDLLISTGRKLSDAKCKQTYYKWRAAVVHERKSQLYEFIAALDSALKTDDFNKKSLIYAEVEVAMRKIMQQISDRPTKRRFDASPGLGEWRQLNKLEPKKERQHLAKRKLLGKLPNNWTSIIWDLAKTSKYQDVIAVFALSGCRPSEVVKGICCETTAENSLNLYIKGSKTGQNNHYGQKTRILTFDIDTPEAQYLVSQCAKSTNNRHVIRLEKARLITDVMRIWSLRMWPKRANNCLTPYVYRQAAFARFKAKWSPEKVAQAMGHSTDKTQQWYALKFQATQGAIPTQIYGSNPVKTKTQLRRNLAQLTLKTCSQTREAAFQP